MTDRPYLNFDLQIDGSGTAYRVRVLDSPAGQAETNVNLPFSELELENFLLRIGRNRGRTRRLESRELEGLREFGTRLFQATMAGDVAGAYRASSSWAEGEGSGLRIRLRLSAAPDLIHIPWEFLFDPVERRFIALSVDSPIVRFLDVPGTSRPLPIAPPIRVLVVISSPTDFEPLDVDQEWSRLKEAVSDIEARGLISLERLPQPTLREFQKALRRDYHVLHFVGHGGFDAQHDDGLLVFEDEQRRGSEVSATYLATLLHDADSLRLAVLNACDGARSSRTDQFAGVAQSLLQQGVPAVVAMQFEITDDAAIAFAREFYGAFADGYSIEASMVEARKSIFAVQNDSEWATPVLYLRSGDTQIFKIVPLAAAPPAPPPAIHEERDPQPAPAPPIVDERQPEPATRGAVPSPSGPPPSEPRAEQSGRKPPWWSRFGRRSRVAAVVAGLGLAGLIGLAAFLGTRGEDSADSDEDDDEFGSDFSDFESFAGTWWTNFARLELEEEDGQVIGSYYPYVSGNLVHEIEGDVEEGDLFGTFADTNLPFAFVREDDEEYFEGYWIDQAGRSHEWCGAREAELPDGCGYSGMWFVRGLPAELDLEDDTIEIIQISDAALVMFTSGRYGWIEMRAGFDAKTLAKATGTFAVTASGSSSTTYTIDWLVSDEAQWDSFKGTWSTPNSRVPGEWCAWRNNAPPPC